MGLCHCHDDGEIVEISTIPTTTPDETVGRAATFILASGLPGIVGVGSFGPVDLHPSSPTFGYITTTPKSGWAHTDLVGSLRQRLGVPVVIDTDVNAAAFGEWRRGAGVGLDSICYMTIGTGVGGGYVVDGKPLHGLLHPELGHIRIPHDRRRDPFGGACPFHGDCFEGLASGESLRLRWGRPAEALTDDAVWELEAEYVALGLVNVIHAISPERIIVGGGVAKHPRLLPLARANVLDLVACYLDSPSLTEAGIGDYIVAPALGDRAGVIGAIELARQDQSSRSGGERDPRSGLTDAHHPQDRDRLR